MGRCWKEGGRKAEEGLWQDSGQDGERGRERFVICSPFHLLPCHASCRGGNTPWCLRETEGKGWVRWRGGGVGKANRGGEEMDRSEKETKEGEIEKERDIVIEKREKIYAYRCVFQVPSPEMQELTTGAGRYANRRMDQCATRLLFLHLLFIYLQGDSLQTKQVIKSSFLFPSRFSPSLFLHIWIARRRGEQARHDGSTASAEVISLANAAAHNCMPADLICIPSANPI